jgi:hypothetical protein
VKKKKRMAAQKCAVVTKNSEGMKRETGEKTMIVKEMKGDTPQTWAGCLIP